jgi:alkylation response protein AidB-like acyl-CoA dehydrogenase
MDLRFSPEEEAFRQEVRDFLSRELPPERRTDPDSVDITDEHHVWARGFDRKLAQKGWLCLSWPEEYGGQAASITKQVVFNEEIYYAGAYSTSSMGVGIVCPAIMAHGTAEQKARLLPGIVSAEHEWSQGFSEPNAGSDLASLTTTAVEQPDGTFVVNGQKIWSSRAHHADNYWLLARTDPQAPKHRGLSTFAVDLRNTPGITIRPVTTILGTSHFSEVFLDNVVLSPESLVGTKNRGWYQAMTTLNFERSGIGRISSLRRTVEQLTEYCRTTPRPNGKLIDDAVVRDKLADLAVEVEAARMLCYRVAWLQSKGQVPSYEASMSRVVGCELSQNVARTGMEILGLAGPFHPESEHAQLLGRLERMYLGTVANTIRSGTSEIQRNIIAQRGLGLPRD